MLHRYKAKHMSNIRVFTAALDAALDELFAHDQVSALEYMSDAADDLNTENSNSSQEERTAVSFLNTGSRNCSRKEQPYKWTQLKYFAIELLSAKSTEAMFL